jgi:hypothetical protein
MSLQEASPGARSSPAVLGPIVDGIGEVESGHDVLADTIEQVFLVLDVVVERHRLDAHLAGDPSHRDGFETLLVHHSNGRFDHSIPSERLSVPHRVPFHVMSCSC